MSSVLPLGFQVPGGRTSEKTDCRGVLLQVCSPGPPLDAIPFSSVSLFQFQPFFEKTPSPPGPSSPPYQKSDLWKDFTVCDH